MGNAPYFADIAKGAEPTQCLWLTTSDDVRIRAAYWAAGPETVLIFPGRTEYIEKYSEVATAMAQAGFSAIVIDWRGQGLSARQGLPPAVGHVGDFSEYQQDIAALLEAFPPVSKLYLIAHSMGGCIGLRALMDGLPVCAAAFTGPMWGLNMALWQKLLAPPLSTLACRLGLGKRFALGQSQVGVNPAFKDNPLTNDPDMYAWMQAQTATHPKLFLGGISWGWLNAALCEMQTLSTQPAPSIPCMTWLGSDETIVSSDAIHHRMAGWSAGELIEVPGIRHEILMDAEAVRQDVYSSMITHFQQSA